MLTGDRPDDDRHAGGGKIRRERLTDDQIIGDRRRRAAPSPQRDPPVPDQVADGIGGRGASKAPLYKHCAGRRTSVDAAEGPMFASPVGPGGAELFRLMGDRSSSVDR